MNNYVDNFSAKSIEQPFSFQHAPSHFGYAATFLFNQSIVLLSMEKQFVVLLHNPYALYGAPFGNKY